jgi:hypothetical protein
MIRSLVISLATICFSLASAQDTTQGFKTITAWKFNFLYKIEGQNLIGQVSCETKGWLAIGFNPTKVMKNANIIIGYADSSTSVVVDQFGSGMFEHKTDTTIGGKNNIIDGKCTEENGITTLSFTILLDSGDPMDGKIVLGQKTKVIFACGKEDDINKKHVKNAKTEIVF